MIKISFKDGLTIEGHANYAEKGKDIICAAVSTLFYAFIEEVKLHPGWYSSIEICDKENVEKKFCKVFLKKDCKSVYELCTESIVNMLKKLVSEYPQYIQIKDV